METAAHQTRKLIALGIDPKQVKLVTRSRKGYWRTRNRAKDPTLDWVAKPEQQKHGGKP